MNKKISVHVKIYSKNKSKKCPFECRFFFKNRCGAFLDCARKTLQRGGSKSFDFGVDVCGRQVFQKIEMSVSDFVIFCEAATKFV